jgi:hypothetical protein
MNSVPFFIAFRYRVTVPVPDLNMYTFQVELENDGVKGAPAPFTFPPEPLSIARPALTVKFG